MNIHGACIYLDSSQHLVEEQFCHWLCELACVHNSVKQLTSLHSIRGGEEEGGINWRCQLLGTRLTVLGRYRVLPGYQRRLQF